MMLTNEEKKNLLGVRKLGLGEEKFKIVAEKFQGSLNEAIYLRIQEDLKADLAKTALSWLQKRHPLLQGSFSEYDSDYNQFDFSHYLTVKEEEKINEVPFRVIPMTGDNHWQELLDTELNTHFSEEVKYLWQATLLNGDGIHDLIVKFYHGICDGSSLGNFARDFLIYYAELAQGSSMPNDFQVEPILPPVEELLPQRKRKSSQATEDNHIEVSPWRYETYQPIEKRRTRWMTHILDSEKLNNLQEACDEQKLSLNSALSVAFLNAVSSILGTPNLGGNFITCTAPIDLRMFCKPKVKPYHFGYFADFLTIVQPIPDSQPIANLESFWDSARFYEQSLMKEIKNSLGSDREIAYNKTKVERDLLNLLSEKEREQQFVFGPIISFPGVLDIPEKLDNLTVENLLILRNEVSGIYPIVGLFYILHNQMYCTFNYCEGLVKNESISAIMRLFVSIVETIQLI